MLHQIPGFLLVVLLPEMCLVQMYTVCLMKLYSILQDQMFLCCLPLPEVLCSILIPHFQSSGLAGVIANVASTPVPCNEYTVGDPAALCVNVKSAVVSPSAVGVYVTSNTWLPPGSIVTGNMFGENVN